MQRGLPNGYGKLTWPNGDYYEGNFKFGKRNGFGKRINVDGSEYQGEYLEDKPNGRGNIDLLYKFKQDFTFGRMEKGTRENGRKENFMVKV
jgi:hypothetical protein